MSVSHPDRFLLAGLMGWPVMHSRSPQLHNYWLAQHGLDGRYLPLAIKTEGLRAAKLTQELNGPIKPLDWAQRHAALDGAAMLINTTNQGMVGEPPLDLALDPLPANALICDIIYIPRETPLLAAARKRGNPTMNGLGMLINQARPAFQAWFGIVPETAPGPRA